MTPMTPTELNALAEKVAGLDGPDRRLDRDIFHLLELNGRPLADDEQNIRTTEARRGHLFLRHIKPFTASLDQAMTLVPEGWGWLVSQPNEKALASGLLKERTPVLGEVQYGCDQRYAVAAVTPALALCSAAIRARAASLLTEEGA